MAKQVQLMARVDSSLAKSFKKRLIDREVTFKAWLIARMEEFINE